MGRKRGDQFRMGSFWRQDDRSGFSVRAEATREEWTGLIVDRKLWEIRQPQDLVKGIPDEQGVPQARPIPPATFDGPQYFQITANLAVGTTFIPLQYIAGISDGDDVGVMLDTGSLFNTFVVGNPVSGGVNVNDPLPYTAASGNLFVDYPILPTVGLQLTNITTESGINITTEGGVNLAIDS